MNFHWHTLAEQLQRHPDLLEDELQGEVAAMSAQAEVQSTPAKEQEVLKRLQAQLGNHGLQQLLSGTTGPSSGSSTQDNSAARATENDQQKTTSADAAKTSEPAIEAQVVERPAGDKTVSEGAPPVEKTSIATAPTATEQFGSEQAGAAQGVREQRVADLALQKKIAPEPVAVDTRKQMQNLLHRILSRLPALDGPVITQFAVLFDQQSPAIKTKIIDTLVARSLALPQPAREKFMTAIRKLTGAVAHSALISSLRVRLLAVAPPTPAPVIEPEPPEE